MNHLAAHGAVKAVGVVVPVHDEEELLRGALDALDSAIDALPPSISCQVAVVLDGCRDASAAIAHGWESRSRLVISHADCQGVGLSRRAGCKALLSSWPETDPAQIWLATTDADFAPVPRDWLTVQLKARASGADMWAGRIRLTEQSSAAQRWFDQYSAESEPVHGANLGYSAILYNQLGGFGGMRSGEDRDLHRRAVEGEFRVTYDCRALVTTSSRRKGRAPEGFARVLASVDDDEFPPSVSRLVS